MTDGLHMSRRIRRTPYTSKVEQAGVRGFSVVNHTLLPKAFQPSVEEDIGICANMCSYGM